MINQEQLDKDKAIVEAATDGYRKHFAAAGKVIIESGSFDGLGVCDARFYDRFNPSYMLQYIQELEAAREELATQNKHARYNNDFYREEMEAHKECRQELQAARERIEELEHFIEFESGFKNIRSELFQDKRIKQLLSQHNTDSEGE